MAGPPKITAKRSIAPVASPQSQPQEKQQRHESIGGFFSAARASAARALFGSKSPEQTHDLRAVDGAHATTASCSNQHAPVIKKKKQICAACLLGLDSAILKTEHGKDGCLGVVKLGGKECVPPKKVAALEMMGGQIKGLQTREADFSSWAYLGFMQK